jgi:hypothetical protein
MIAELITPLMLATAPMTISATEPLQYSHEQQKIEAPASTILAQYRPTTYGATQTYDVSGRPWDNDND